LSPDPDLVEIDDAAVCRWLSWSFARELDVDTLQVYNSGGATPIFTYLARHEGLAIPLERLKRAITTWSFLVDPELELAADFATLFLVSGDAGAPPYASCYTAPGNLFGTPHDRMIKKLEATGLVASILPDEPADHLAIMLDYLAHCFAANKLTPAASHPFEEATEFIRNELLTWLPTFQERAERVRVASDMHKALIALTVEALVAFSRTHSASGSRTI
jgi:TorA-specific chaperone